MRFAFGVSASAFAALILAACGTVTTSHRDEAVNSIIFDETPCAELIQQRNSLADANGLARDVKYLPSDGGAMSFDLRSQSAREQASVIARVDAMNHSLMRRSCGG